MLLNDLDTTLRNAGLTVTETAGWVGWNHGPMTDVQTITIHHTGTSAAAGGDYPSLNIVRAGRPDLDGPLAQLGCGRSGRMYVISNGVCWHTGATLQSWQGNYHSIGIECESPGSGAAWPAAQVNAVARAAAALCRKYGVPSSRVLGHKEICSPPGRKPDPVGIPGDMPAFRKLVQQYINNPQGDVQDMEPTDVAKDPGGGRWGWFWLNTQANALTVKNYVTGTVGPGVAAARASADAAKAAVAALSAKVDALSAKVDGIQSGTVSVDVDAFVSQLVPVLSPALRAAEDRAARDGDPTTGPVT